jgi:hypothetical protein
MKDTPGARNADLSARKNGGYDYLESSGYDDAKPLRAALLFAWSSEIPHLLSVAARVRFPQVHQMNLIQDPPMRSARAHSPLCVFRIIFRVFALRINFTACPSQMNGKATFTESINLLAKVSSRRY